MSQGTQILSTDEGRYIWFPILSCVDFIPKGKQAVQVTLGMPFAKRGDPLAALITAVRHAGGEVNEKALREAALQPN